MKDIAKIDDRLHDLITMSDVESVSLSTFLAEVEIMQYSKNFLPYKVFQEDTEGDSDDPVEQPRKRFKANSTEQSTSNDTSSSSDSN